MKNIQEVATLDNDSQWLKKFGYVREPTTKECQELMHRMHHVYAGDGEILFEEGERGTQLFIVRQGTVTLGHKALRRKWVDMGPFGCVNMDEERSSPLWTERVTLHEGDCVGEATFLLDLPHTKTAMAQGEVDLLCIDASQFRLLAQHHPDLCQCLAARLKRSLQAVRR